MKKLVALTVLMAVATISLAQEKPMDAFIDKLMSKMTVKEKIGQLNLLPSGVIQTGISENSPVMELIASGQLGGVLNVRGVKEVRELQEAVVKKSRLGIPLIFGLDVIHGYETIFPIPLALSCSWDLPAIERVARIAAVEATADGICWTYSPISPSMPDGDASPRAVAKIRIWDRASPKSSFAAIRVGESGLPPTSSWPA